MKPIITQGLMASLLGRHLTEVETNNFDLYFNIAITRLDDLLCTKIEKMDDISVDLQLLIARCFAVIPMEQEAISTHGINKKQVEDFSISYESQADVDSPMVAFVKQNESIINKYSQCTGAIRSGKVCHGCEMFRCI